MLMLLSSIIYTSNICRIPEIFTKNLMEFDAKYVTHHNHLASPTIKGICITQQYNQLWSDFDNPQMKAYYKLKHKIYYYLQIYYLCQ